MMKRLMESTLVAVFLFAAGCSSVSSMHPVGVADAELGERLTGTWEANGESVHIHHIADGVIRIAGVQWKDNAFKLSEFTATVTRNKLVGYVNLWHEGKEDEPTTYSFMRILSVDDEHLVVVGPEVGAFKQAVNDGDLKGTVTERENSTSVVLKGEKGELDDYILPSRAGQQFSLSSPMVLRRLKEKDE